MVAMENGDTLGRRIALRLDDGSLICNPSSIRMGSDGPCSAVRIDVERAFEAGKLGPEHVVRMEGLVYRMEALLYGDTWVEQSFSGSKRKPADGQEYTNGDLKRARSTLGPSTTANGAPAARHAGSPSMASQGSWGVGEFEAKCLEMVQHLLTELAHDAYIFANPVDGAKIKDYYTIITQPMDLGTIQGKLSRHEYRNPSEFYDDVLLVWANCNIYNKKGDYVQKLGMRCEASFQRMWAASGLCPSHRARRTNAGVAAEKYEPQVMLPPAKKPGGPAPGGKGPRGPMGAAKSARSRQGLDRLRSTGSCKQRSRPMTQEQLQTLARVLQQLEGPALEGAIAIIKESSPIGGEEGDGEIELDFDALDPDTLWKLYDFVQNSAGRAASALNNTFKAVDGSESDSDSESEE